VGFGVAFLLSVAQERYLYLVWVVKILPVWLKVETPYKEVGGVEETAG
jgi:hypothetical protein